MLLAGKKLREKLESNHIKIDNLIHSNIQPSSIDLTLADEFLIIDDNKCHLIDLSKEIPYRKIINHEIIIPPKSFVLAKTKEFLNIPLDHAAMVEGKSSIGRLGLFIQNAGLINPGFKGTLTLELFNANSVPIKLEAHRQICQLILIKLDGELEQGYQGKYQGQIEVTGSKIYKQN